MILNLLGAGGSGKTTLKFALSKRDGFHFFVPVTTRAKRPGEIEGVDYHFTTTEEFEQDDSIILRRDTGQGRLYGNRKGSIVNHKSITVTTLDINGIKSLIAMEIPLKVVYLNIPEDERRRRMLRRGDTIQRVDERLMIDRVYFHNLEIESPFLEVVNGTVGEIVQKIERLLDM
jgi:guanylate kinase